MVSWLGISLPWLVSCLLLILVPLSLSLSVVQSTAPIFTLVSQVTLVTLDRRGGITVTMSCSQDCSLFLLAGLLMTGV